MRIIRWAVIFWTVSVTVLTGLAIRNLNNKTFTETRTFCAYGRVFVEFEESGRVWGTLMLDFRGQPIPCKDDVEPELSNTI